MPVGSPGSEDALAPPDSSVPSLSEEGGNASKSKVASPSKAKVASPSKAKVASPSTPKVASPRKNTVVAPTRPDPCEFFRFAFQQTVASPIKPVLEDEKREKKKKKKKKTIVDDGKICEADESVLLEASGVEPLPASWHGIAESAKPRMAKKKAEREARQAEKEEAKAEKEAAKTLKSQAKEDTRKGKGRGTTSEGMGEGKASKSKGRGKASKGKGRGKASKGKGRGTTRKGKGRGRGRSKATEEAEPERQEPESATRRIRLAQKTNNSESTRDQSVDDIPELEWSDEMNGWVAKEQDAGGQASGGQDCKAQDNLCQEIAKVRGVKKSGMKATSKALKGNFVFH